MTPARSTSLLVLALGLAACRQQQPASVAAPAAPTAPGAPAAPAPGAPGTFRPPDNTYGVVLPSGWTVQSVGEIPPDVNGNPVAGSIVAVSNAAQPLLGVIQIASSPAPAVVHWEGAMSGAITGMQQTPGVEAGSVAESGRQAISVGGLDGMEHILTYTGQGMALQGRGIYVVGNGRLYGLVLNAPQQTYNQAESAFLSLVQSFQPG